MSEARRNRSKRSHNSVENSVINNSEENENHLGCTGGERLLGVRDKISRVALAHLLAWGEISNNKDSREIQKFYHQINNNAGELDPLAGILSRHLSKGAELYLK